MFRSLSVVKDVGGGAGRQYCYELIDTDFIETFTTTSGYFNDPNVAIEVIKIYSRKKRYVVRALQLFYKYLHNCGYDINRTLLEHYTRIDRIDATLNYKRQYYPLMLGYYLRKFVR